MTGTPTTHTPSATPRRRRARLLVPAAIAVAFTATTAAADTSPTTAVGTATAHDRRGPSRSRKAMLDAWLRLGTAISPRPRGSSLPDSASTPPSSTAVTAAPSGASTAW